MPEARTRRLSSAQTFSHPPHGRATPESDRPLVILGAGYAGVKLAHEVWRRSSGSIPTTLVDRHPFHVIRTELYEVAKLAERGSDIRRWAIPIDRIVGREGVVYREGSVEAIDLAAGSVTLAGRPLPYRLLAICLGNVPAYYGVPGAAEHTHQVYGLLGAMRLATALRDVEVASRSLPPGVRPRVLVVGGGATGVQLAADIASADWRRIAKRTARRPEVTLICGALPLLDGLDPELVRHARRLLERAGVELDEGRNVVRVDPGITTLVDGERKPFDVGVWAAGVEVPAVVRPLPVPHGKAGRLVVEPTLEIAGHAGVFAIGDVAQLTDPVTKAVAPATAQAALREAAAAAENVVLRWEGREPTPFRYRERGTIVAVGERRAAARWNRVLIWGSPAALLKSILDREYRLASGLGREAKGY